MNIIAIDSGFGYLKALVNNKQIKFPNIVGNYRPSPDGMIGQEKDLSISVDNLGAWNFGNTAVLQSSTFGRRQDSERIFTKEFLAGLLLAISEGYSKETREMSVDIITGLPGSEYNRDKEYKSKFRKFVIGNYQIQRPDYKQQITINSIRWTNQAWGSIWKHLIDEKGNPIKPDTKANVVQIGNVNIGYRTVEIGTVEVSGIQSGRLRVQTAGGIELSEPGGVHKLIDALKINLVDVFNKNFSAEKSIEVLENNGLILNGQWLDYELPDNIKEYFSDAIRNYMSKVYDDGTGFLYRLILTGGGAGIVKDAFGHIPQVLISNNPQWDTVEGYMRLGKFISKRG